MYHKGLVHGCRNAQVAFKHPCLNLKACPPQGVHSRLADGQHLIVMRTALQAREIVIGEGIHVMPGMESY